MKRKRNIFSCCLRCIKQRGSQSPDEIRPLSEHCGCSRVRVCKVSGDRHTCGRMASLGVLPGTVLELLCPARRGQGRKQCMVKINGGTLSLDSLTARNIFVCPL
ncbi:MAG: ferrous iron transport protein A [Candidatus Electrothrix sp. AW2]|nr:ferrous iron transport protein A [Candidatus Electrothrix sp. AX1]MCI5127313.1 ferrous iron transport protein A [Candidatus Electrothrix gigas]MCW5212516.1 ferrous iron transport protein A [Desulfobulbus sp. TB]MCI5135265.1 ferrous iron transport protein A [Candidatus Electrothrix gigas]MCI5179259.1 ferrous iron transport protein A [Candidatus Electrothrix gigas]